MSGPKSSSYVISARQRALLLEQQKREQAAAAPEITFGDQELYELLMGIPGFGPVRSMAVIDAIYEKVEGMNDGTEGKA